MCLLMDSNLQSKHIISIQCRLWYIKPRSLHWWALYHDEVMQNDHERFRRMFSFSIRTFNYLCELLGNDMRRKTPTSFHSILDRKLEVDKQIAMSLHRLATGDSLLSILELFRVSLETVSKTIKRFIIAMTLQRKHHLQ